MSSPPDGFLCRPSRFGVAETVRRLREAVVARGMEVLGHVDHGAGAEAAGLALPPTQLLLFGAARAGTPLMQAAPTVAIDLPLKALVWVDRDGQVWLGMNDPAWVARRHGVEGADVATTAMRRALDAVADLAAEAGD